MKCENGMTTAQCSTAMKIMFETLQIYAGDYAGKRKRTPLNDKGALAKLALEDVKRIINKD